MDKEKIEKAKSWLENAIGLERIMSDYYSSLKDTKILKGLMLVQEAINELEQKIESQNKEIEKLEVLKKMSAEIINNSILKPKIQDEIIERKYKLQQEYKNFENDETLIVLQRLLEEEKENGNS